MSWTYRIRSRENAIRTRWPLRHDDATQRYMIRAHVSRLRAERIAEREQWEPLSAA